MKIQFLLFFLYNQTISQHIAREYRTYSGKHNNPSAPSWGEAGTPFSRSFPPDDINFEKPQAVELSKLAQLKNLQFQNRSILNLGFGQFIAHDIGFMQPSSNKIELGGVSFTKSTFQLFNGQEQQVNSVSHFLDGSVIYGDEKRLEIIAVKPFLIETDFILKKASESKDTKVFGNKENVLSTGDLRGNDNPILMLFQILFVKEHNRQVKELQKNQQFKSLDNQKLFEEARRRVIAILQHIAYDEWLPLLIGEKLPDYKGYNIKIFPNVENFVSSVSLRIMHSNVIDNLNLVDENLKQIGTFSIKRNLQFIQIRFVSNYLWRQNIDIKTLFFSMSIQKEKKTDIRKLIYKEYDDVLRNIKTTKSTIDMFAIDILRARDSSVSNYFQARQFYLQEKQMPEVNQILNNCQNKNEILKIYNGDIEKIDSLIGLLCEQPVNNGFIGPTSVESLKQTFIKLRDGDRFWYEKDMTQEEILEIKKINMSKLINLNFNIKNLNQNVFQL